MPQVRDMGKSPDFDSEGKSPCTLWPAHLREPEARADGHGNHPKPNNPQGRHAPAFLDRVLPAHGLACDYLRHIRDIAMHPTAGKHITEPEEVRAVVASIGDELFPEEREKDCLHKHREAETTQALDGLGHDLGQLREFRARVNRALWSDCGNLCNPLAGFICP